MLGFTPKKIKSSNTRSFSVSQSVDYKGTLGEAKSTINRFLRNDCRQLGVVEIGNGNNRNITDRLEPLLQKECSKYNLPDHGDYFQLRIRLKDKKPFNTFIPFDDVRSITTERVKVVEIQQEKVKKPKKEKTEKAVKTEKVTQNANVE